MSYYMTKTVAIPFDEALSKTIAELKREGFGIITEIDVTETLSKKLGVAFRKYRILGACNPQFAHRALQEEDKIGVLLPCNLVVQETTDGKTEISSINPAESMRGVANPRLADLAGSVQGALQRVLDRL
jgi:uncharacterized protein (DUF302 family)